MIPSAVAGEIRSSVGPHRWLHVQSVAQPATSHSLLSRLDPGEGEAIALALQLNAVRLLIDERRGRRVAQGLGLGVIGTLGVVLLAKQLRLIPLAGPLFDELLATGFFASDMLIATMLRDADEGA